MGFIDQLLAAVPAYVLAAMPIFVVGVFIVGLRWPASRAMVYSFLKDFRIPMTLSEVSEK